MHTTDTARLRAPLGGSGANLTWWQVCCQRRAELGRISDFINLSAESTELLATDPWTDDVAEELERSIKCDLVNSLLYVSGP